MKKIVILFFLLNSGICFSQQYALWLSGDGSYDASYDTSMGRYVNRKYIYYYSFEPPTLSTGESILNTGIHDITTSDFPLDGRYHAYDNPNFNNVTCETNGTFQVNKYQTVFIGTESDEANLSCNAGINHYYSYTDPKNIYQWGVILPKYVQPSIADRERIATDKLFLSTSNTFPESPVDIPYVRWEYQINSNTWWSTFPSDISSKFPMNATVEEILQNEFTPISDVNTLRVRIVLSPPQSAVESIIFPGTYNYTNMPVVNSDILIFDIKSASPQLTSFDPVDTQCSYSSDGGFTAIFDRDLNAGETLIMTLYEVDGFGNEILQNQQSTTILGAGNTYTWPVAQPSGDYLVKYQTENNGTFSSLETSGQFTIDSPDPVVFSATKINDVYCFGGSDGTIALTAGGGVGNYQFKVEKDGATYQDWTAFSSTDAHTLSGLPAGSYTLYVHDANGCEEQLGDGTEKTITIAIEEPTEAVALDLASLQNATANGFTDGSISVDISGGTPFGDGSYTFEWTDGSGAVGNSFTSQNVATGYRTTLNDIGAGDYTLTVTDANFNSATQTGGCTVIGTYTIDEPPALDLTVQETGSISCNSANGFGDPSSDGELTAVASGGIPFDPPLPGGNLYRYTWKQKDASGNYQVMAGITGPVASGLPAGDYAVNIEDANGIVIGTYQDNALVVATDMEHPLNEPPLLSVTLSKQDVFCPGGSDGSITATITGGTGTYDILWNTGETSPTINNLTAGTYTIWVTDEKGCQAEASVTLTEPENPLQVTYTESKPTYTGATDGWIKATVTGGTPKNDGSYGYLWKNVTGNDLAGQVTAQMTAEGYVLTLNGIGSGSYFLTIEDANYALATDNANCTIIESEHFLEEPAPLTLVVTEQSPISCNSGNIYGDPSADGALEAEASGGVILAPGDNKGLPYYYTWKKFVDGSWQVLAGQTTNIASGLDAGLYAVNIEDANGIVIGTYENNVLVEANDVEHTLEDPPPLELDFNKQDVYCFEGSDGWAEAVVSGGTPPYSYRWDDGATTSKIMDLPQGLYDVTITDSRGCQVSGSIDISAPVEPLQVNYTAFDRPSTFEGSDGWIRAEITGGTAMADGSYNYSWRDENGNDISGQSTASLTADGTYQVELDNLPSGTYYLTVEDANYSDATTKDGCTVLDSSFTLFEPIEATIEEVLPISCNSANTFENPYSDGVLIATVQGGVPFETGQPYTYHWKKQDASGNWQALPNQTSEIAADLSVGNYALNVEDSIGNVIGVYQGSTLVEATDVLYDFQQPELLTVNLSSTAISCGAGNDGTATVGVSGGSGNYSLQWSNGAITETTTGLIAGTYFVHVMDERGCEATGQVTIEQPGGLDIAVTVQDAPSCTGGANGAVEINVTGGSPPYTYLWNTGDTGTAINGLTAGTYRVQMTDANGCVAFKEVTLEDPEPIIVDLGEDRTLCGGQELALDISIDDPGATYLWQSDTGFNSTSSQVSLSQAGTYTATVTTVNGCTGSDTIVIATSAADIDSEFVISTQGFVGEDIVLVNTSDPISSQSEWILPEEAQIIQQDPENITLRFAKVGVYEVTLRSHQGECYQDFSKPIIVEHASELPGVGDTENPFIEEFIVYPNPNSGQFTVAVTLVEQATVSLRLFSQVNNIAIDDRLLYGSDHYNTSYQVSLPSGVYVLLLETPEMRDIRKIVIQ